MYETALNATPITLLVPDDSAFLNETIPFEQLDDVLENHIFEGLLFTDELQAMDGELITSVNGKQWLVEVLGGTVFISSEGGEPVALQGSTDILFRDGVVHLLDTVLQEAQSTTPLPTTLAAKPSPSPTQSPSNPSPTLSPGSPKSCSACDNGFESSNVLPGGLLCSDWEGQVSSLEAGSEACLLERAIGIQYCGCFASEFKVTCDICPGSSLDNQLKLPDARSLSCASLRNIESVDGETTCSILEQKYSSWCQCELPANPTCSLCKTGEYQEKPFIALSTEKALVSDRVFGRLSDPSCKGFADFLAVQTSETCSSIDDELLKDVAFDMRAWCECSGIAPPRVCGEMCSAGTILQEAVVPGGAESGLTCRELSEIAPFLKDESLCDAVKEVSYVCCETPAFAVNTSFVVFNQDNLEAVDLAKAASARILQRAFDEFVESLFAELEGEQRQLHLASRRLTATLRPDSSTIAAVAPMDCPNTNTIPKDATCQQVFSTYELYVEDEDPVVAVARFVDATERAIDEGKLQAKLDQEDPEYPFTISGVATSDSYDQNNASDDKMTWWVILVVVLGCVFGACGLCCIGAYFVEGSRKTDPGPHPDSRDLEEAPLVEVSVRLLNGDDTDDSSGSVDNSKSRSTMKKSRESGDFVEAAKEEAVDVEEDLWEDNESWEDDEEEGGNADSDGSWDDDGRWEDSDTPVMAEVLDDAGMWEDGDKAAVDEEEPEIIPPPAAVTDDDDSGDEAPEAWNDEDIEDDDVKAFLALDTSDSQRYENGPAEILGGEMSDEPMPTKTSPTSTDGSSDQEFFDAPQDISDSGPIEVDAQGPSRVIDADGDVVEGVEKLQEGIEELQSELADFEHRVSAQPQELEQLVEHGSFEDEYKEDQVVSLPAIDTTPSAAPPTDPDGKTAKWISIHDALGQDPDESDAA